MPNTNTVQLLNTVLCMCARAHVCEYECECLFLSDLSLVQNELFPLRNYLLPTMSSPRLTLSRAFSLLSSSSSPKHKINVLEKSELFPSIAVVPASLARCVAAKAYKYIIAIAVALIRQPSARVHFPRIFCAPENSSLRL